MRRRSFVATLAGLCLLAVVGAAFAVIVAPLPLNALISSADYTFAAKIEKINADAERPTVLLEVEEDIKGKFPIRKVPLVFVGDAEAKKLDHPGQLLKRMQVGQSVVFFVNKKGTKKLVIRACADGAWMSIDGSITGENMAVYQLLTGEPYLRKTYKGSSDDLRKLLKDHLADKTKLPDLDEKETPGFGPEPKGKQSSWLKLPASGSGRSLFGVIPTLGIGGPIAILALLFPAVFGGVLVLFRQWSAFLAMFSVNSTLMLLHWWKGGTWFRDTWLATPGGLWFAMTVVTLIFTLIAWRRQLDNLASGADALETPSRTELLVLLILSGTCLASDAFFFFVGERPSIRDVNWSVMLVWTAGFVGALVHKVYRTVVETMIPVATEGVMLGVNLLGYVVLGALVWGQGDAPIKAIVTQNTSTDAEAPKFVSKLWEHRTKDNGVFVSTPAVVGNRVYAASAHPITKGANLVALDLRNGRKLWEFEDDGEFKQAISSPTVAEGSIYIGEGFHDDKECKVYCLDAETGAKNWEYKTGSQTESSPVVRADKVFIGAGNDGFLCLDAASGKKVWQFPETGYDGRLLRFGARPLVTKDRIFAGTGVDRNQPKDKGETAVFCLDAATGKQVWKTAVDLPCWAAPVEKDGVLYVALGNGDIVEDAPNPAGKIIALKSSNGTLVWSYDLPNGVLDRVSLDKGHVWAGCRDGYVYCLNRTTGKLAWSVDMGAPVIATPTTAQSGGKGPVVSVFALSTHGLLRALNPATGTTQWEYSLGGQGLHFSAAPKVIVHPRKDGSDERWIVFGGGSMRSEAKAVLFCVEDHVPARPAPTAAKE
ncbi:MAG: PQQ-binding-like beta-propeller repeat protein [Gemmataceae bacterium]|nr:PQQ-binding-like beta-propeller repeat protein [Gemmataceae bacterium]